MSRIDFERDDLGVQVRRLPDGDVKLRASLAATSWEVVIPALSVRGWPDKPQLSGFLPPTAIAEWSKQHAPAAPEARLLRRVTVDIADADLAVLRWEQALDFGVPVVRVSAVRPHAEAISFTLPLRIVQVSPIATFSTPKLVYGLFGRMTQKDIHSAVEVQAVPTLSSLGRKAVSAKPTLDVLHFSSWREFAAHRDRLSFADASAQGTVAWLARCCFAWQTRLVVFHCDRQGDFDNAVRFAAELLSVGGPAIVVERLKLARARMFYRSFYSDLIHDFPLDEALNRTLFQAGLRSEISSSVSLFAGAGREEGLRVSTIAIKMLQIARTVSRPRLPGVYPELSAVLNRGALRPLRPPSLRRADDFANEFRSLDRGWKNYEFEFHEHGGLLPLASHLKNIRSIIRTHPGKRRPLVIQDFAVAAQPGRTATERYIPDVDREERLLTLRKAMKARTPEGAGDPRYIIKKYIPNVVSTERSLAFKKAMKGGTREVAALPRASKLARYLNSAFWQEDREGHLVEIKQKGTSLMEGKIYQVGVDIGPRDVRIVVSGATSILEEIFRWTPDMPGAWVEIGVTGIDFEVIGSPVRELWLPRTGPSERIYFPVVPTSHAGVAQLRLCLYHNQQIVQSFRMAAVICSEDTKVTVVERRKLLSSALGLPAKSMGNMGFLARLEYTVGSVNEIAEKQLDKSRSQISIVANELNGQSVITIKGAGFHDVNILADNDVSTYVKNIRGALEKASSKTFSNGEKAYLFGDSNEGSNATTPEKLGERIRGIAQTGWQLFDKLLPGDRRDELADLLAPEGTNIRVAHILREKVIPWGVLYDRMYDPDKEEDASGNKVGFSFCPARMPDPQGNQRTGECFKSPDCVLHGYPEKSIKNSDGETLLPETVVCPLHFWGFRHIIEVPPQQVEPGGNGQTMPNRITVSGQLQMAVGANGTLALQKEHMHDLETLAGTYKVAWTEPSYRRDQVIERLKHKDLAIVYLYCHAFGGEESELKIPELHFQRLTDSKPGKIKPDALQWGTKWQCSPLVFLNGCGTVGYTPDALSPFLKKLVDDRGASGVIGTEILVWEQLATEMAKRFLEAFLAKESAGRALLEARLALLAQNNPLGLVYTLYAPSDLVISFTN